MSHENVAVGGIETRKSLIRVWMAVSAVWVAFWLLTAATVVAAAAGRNPLAGELEIFLAIVLTPPLALLAIGTFVRCLVEAFSRSYEA